MNELRAELIKQLWQVSEQGTKVIEHYGIAITETRKQIKASNKDVMIEFNTLLSEQYLAKEIIKPRAFYRFTDKGSKLCSEK
jgi:CTP-dependent riboflavin kinase